MKKLILSLILILAFASVASAQVTFPLTLRAIWNPNPATENVVTYIFTINGVVTNFPAGSCSATQCIQSVTLPNAGPHTISVVAVSAIASGPPATLTFTAIAPTTVIGLTLAK